MSFSFWSDEDCLFVPRLLGWSINFKFIAKKLGWIKPSASEIEPPTHQDPETSSETRKERLRRAIERSRSEDGQ